MSIKISEKEEIFIKKGRMVKSPFAMSPGELQAWEESETNHVRDHLFSINQPLVYKRQNGYMIAEYRDGSIKEL